MADGQPIISQSHTYWMLLAGAPLLGIGTAVFHPEASRVARMALDKGTARVREPVKIGVCGPENRRWILNYLRDHYEEMRPYSMPASNAPILCKINRMTCVFETPSIRI
jgi:hypothetical protein